MSIQFIFQVLHSANIYSKDASKKMIYTHGVLIFSQRGIIIKISGCYNK